MQALRPALLALAVLAPAPSRADLEDEVKAAYLFRFLSYVEWLTSATEGGEGPFVIGVVGSDEVFAALQQIVRGRLAQGRPVEVRRLEEGEAPRGVHMVFVGRAAAGSLSRLSRQDGVVLVSEIAGALRRGAMVNLVRSQDHVRFEVAPTVAERKGVRISSRMLAVAERIEMGVP